VNDKRGLQTEQNIPGWARDVYRTRKERAIPSGNAVTPTPVPHGLLAAHPGQSKSITSQPAKRYVRVKLKDFEDIATAFSNEPRSRGQNPGQGELDIVSRRGEHIMNQRRATPSCRRYVRRSHVNHQRDAMVKQNAISSGPTPDHGRSRDDRPMVHQKGMTHKGLWQSVATAARTAKSWRAMY